MKFGRRSFIALASGLLLPSPEPVRVYSFMPGYRLIDRETIAMLAEHPSVVLQDWPMPLGGDWVAFSTVPDGRKIGASISRSVERDYRESARVWGVELRFA